MKKIFTIISVLLFCALTNSLLAQGAKIDRQKHESVKKRIDDTNHEIFEKAAKGSIIVGTETNTGYNLPIEPYYGFSYSQSIYLQAEIGQSGYISRIAYYYAPESSLASLINSLDWTIYMTTSTKYEYTDNDDWVDISEFTMVFDGTITPVSEAGWLFFDLDIPFYYDNTENLIIAVNEHQIYYDRDEDDFYVSATPEGNYRSIEYYEDTENPDPASPPSADDYYDYIPNTQFVFAENDDLAVKNISYGQPLFSSNHNISAIIKNYGINAQSDFTVSLTFNGFTYTETFSGTLAPNTEMEYTFTQIIDLSEEDIYDVQVSVTPTNDDDLANNAKTIQINTITNNNALANLSDNNDIYNCIKIEDNEAFDYGNFTFETWLYIDNQYSEYHGIFSKMDCYNWDAGYYVYTQNSNIFFAIEGYDNEFSVACPYNEWVHFACTYDGSFSRIFINGVFAGEYEYTTGISPTDYDVYVGGLGSPWDNLNGKMEETRLWSLALTEAQIQENMHKQLDINEEYEHLVLYYNYNQGISEDDNTSIASVYDWSGNNLHGLLIGHQLTETNDTSNFVNSDVLLICQDLTALHVCSYDTYDLLFNALGSAGLTYQWQVSTDGGVSFNDITGENNDTLDIIYDATSQNYLYTCVLTDGSFVITTDTVAIVLFDLPIALAGDDFEIECSLSTQLNANEPESSETGIWSILFGEGSFDNASAYDAVFTSNSADLSVIVWTVISENCSNTDTIELNFLADIEDPTISCLENDTIYLNDGETFYTVVLEEFNPTVMDDNCSIVSIENDFNNLASLEGAELPIGINTIIWTITDFGGNTAICTHNVIVNAYVGISLANQIAPTVFPNPSKDIFELNLNEANINLELTDITGKVIFEKTSNSNLTIIDLSKKEPGIYLLNFVYQNKPYTIKLVKE
ncbi:MAG: T9SS type A sorting domain-containing protein [Bacteroidales bacterium]|nr:T9SS type A sorting domain-containing protein [Bacteroidales bacterium]